ncbi:MAG TPA: RNA-binding protein, partial [Thermoanaerobaculia bacterium]
MANDDRERGRYRDRGNRGMFGYEGEGYMRGGDFSRGRDRGDFGSSYPPGELGDSGWGRSGGEYRGEDYFGSRGYSDLEAGRPSFRGRGPKNYQRSDDRIREEVCERLTWADDVDATEIDVNV